LTAKIQIHVAHPNNEKVIQEMGKSLVTPSQAINQSIELLPAVV
jgi:predicted naringenin-chalcone synthase